MKKTKDTQYLFLSANIRALQTKMIGTQALQKMISAASPEEAYKTVNDAGIGADIDYKDFESALTQELASTYERLEKASDDRELMFEKFNDIHKLLEQQLWRGIEDGSIRELLVKETAQILMSLVVGANRTRVLTPYAPPHLYREAVAFAARAITPCNACE